MWPVAHRKSLNEKQIDVLRWIANGRPAGVMEGHAHRISTAALRTRSLVETSGRGAGWSATITASGHEYLKRAAGPNAPKPRQASVSVAQQLVDEVIAAQGSLRVPRRSFRDQEGVDYENRARLAERHGKVHDGKRLRVTTVSPEELQIDFIDPPEGMPSARPVPVLQRGARHHPVVRQFKERTQYQEISRAALPRALRVLHALVSEAERRGHDAQLATSSRTDGYGRSSWTAARDGHVVISVEGCSAALRMQEEGLQTRAYWEAQNRTYDYNRPGPARVRLPPISEYEAGATGSLSLELVTGFGERGRAAKWGDRKSWTLEDKLPAVLLEIETRAVEHELRRQQAERDAAERERARQAALARARERHAHEHRAQTLLREVQNWDEAQAIRNYAAAAEAAYPDSPPTVEWVAWARGYARQLDPLETRAGSARSTRGARGRTAALPRPTDSYPSVRRW